MIYRVRRPTERDCGDFKFLIDLNRELALDTILSMCSTSLNVDINMTRRFLM